MKKIVSVFCAFVFAVAFVATSVCFASSFDVANAIVETDIVILDTDISDETAASIGCETSSYTPSLGNGDRMEGKALVLSTKTTEISFVNDLEENVANTSSNKSVYLWLFIKKADDATSMTFTLSGEVESSTCSLAWNLAKDSLFTEEEIENGVVAAGWRQIELKFEEARPVSGAIDLCHFNKFKISYHGTDFKPWVYAIYTAESSFRDAKYYAVPDSEQGYNEVGVSSQFANTFVGCLTGDAIVMPKFSNSFRYAWIDEQKVTTQSVDFEAGEHLINGSFAEIADGFNAKWELLLISPSGEKRYCDFGENAGAFSEHGTYRLQIVLRASISGSKQDMASGDMLSFEVLEKTSGIWFQNKSVSIDDKYEYVIEFGVNRDYWNIINADEIEVKSSNSNVLEIVAVEYNGGNVGYIKVKGKKKGKATITITSDCVRNSLVSSGSSVECFDASIEITVQKDTTEASEKTLTIVLAVVLGTLLAVGTAAAVVSIVKHNRMKIK